jgi:hypothetical protein
MVRVPPLRSLLLGAGLVALGGCQTKHHLDKNPLERPAPVAAPSPRPLPQTAFEGTQGSLLDEYVNRRERPPGPRDPKDADEYIPTEAEVRGFTLPNNSKKIVTSLLTFAAQDNLPRAATLFTEQARWGAPDRREPEARPILADGGAAFFDILREVAARFGQKENLTCPPIMPAATVYVRNGAEPMWCFYISNDNLDILAFKFIHEAGSAKIDYVGLHEVRPQGQVQRPGPLPPPMTPNLRRASRPGLERPSADGTPPGEGPLAPDGGIPLGPGGVPLGVGQPLGGPPPVVPPNGAPQPVAVPPVQPGPAPASSPGSPATSPAAPTKAGQPAAPAPEPAKAPKPKPPAKAQPAPEPAKVPAPEPAKAPAPEPAKAPAPEPEPAKAPPAP